MSTATQSHPEATTRPTPESAPANPAPSQERARSRLRLAFFLMLGVYPLINVLLYLVMPFTSGWQIWQVTLVVVPLMVPIMVFGVMPAIQRLFGRFILVQAR